MKSKGEIIKEHLATRWIKAYKDSDHMLVGNIYSNSEFEQGFNAALKYVWEMAKGEWENEDEGEYAYIMLKKICEVKDE